MHSPVMENICKSIKQFDHQQAHYFMCSEHNERNIEIASYELSTMIKNLVNGIQADLKETQKELNKYKKIHNKIHNAVN